MKLAERRRHLVAQASAQRMALAQNMAVWHRPLALADTGLAALRFIKSHPVWIAGGSLLLSSLRPGGLGKWLRRGWLTWQVIRKLRSPKV